MPALDLALLSQSGLARAAAQSEDATTIINIAATAEALAVSLLGAALANASKYTGVPNQSGAGLPSSLVTILKAVQASEQAHYDYLTGAGAKPLTTTFNIPDPKIATDYTTLFKTLETLEDAFISAYEAAATEFSQMGKPDLVKVAYQIGSIEGEHRALARFALGDQIPHNLAFSMSEFATVGAAANALKQLGFIGGTGTALNFADFNGKADMSLISNTTPGGVAASTTGAASTTAPAPSTAPSTAPATTPAQAPAQIPAQMPNTGAGGMANGGSWPTAAALVGGLVVAGLGLRARRMGARE